MNPETQDTKLETDDLRRRARRIKLLLMDCDGVMTDGRITLLPDGDEQKTFHVRDGQGIVLFHRAGLQTGIISGRSSKGTKRRGDELEMTFVKQGVQNKLEALSEVLSAAGVSEDQCAFIGDDVGDIPLLQKVGFAVAVGDAAEETKRAAHYVTKRKGGRGAVRETIDLILKARKANL